MSKIKTFINRFGKSLGALILRFPIVILSLAFLSTLIALLIEDEISGSFISRLILTGVFSAFLSLFASFLSERLNISSNLRLGIQASSLLISVVYFFLFTSSSGSLFEIVRLVVLAFALLALTLFIPAFKSSVEFGKVALIHFKAFFTAALYSGVLFVGLLAIYLAIDLLLFDLNDRAIAHIANAVFLLFAPVYYLSLLQPDNSTYPKILNILVSYILIPLLAAFTGVLAAYLIKILLTQVWPVGQIGPMVLAYSASGFIVYILSVELENKFAVYFKKLYPFALIPLVGLQLYSIYIRINAYGITESRYYLILFGLFSLVCAGYLIISKSKNAKIIVLLAACFAIVSIVPPVDAFNVSRASQTSRVEAILVRNNMLSGNKITPKSDISAKDKSEITSIMNYMASMGHLKSLEWFPAEYRDRGYLYNEYETIFGFSPYNSPGIDSPLYYSVNMNKSEPLDISGYSLMLTLDLYTSEEDPHLLSTFTLNGENYSLYSKNSSKGEPTLALLNAEGVEILQIPTTDIISGIQSTTNKSETLPPDELTASATNGNISVRLYFDRLHFEEYNGVMSGFNGNIIVLVSKG